LLNSCLELDIAAHRALFLPKLQSYFAEFLKEGSPALLGILYLPTCVGFGTVLCWSYFQEQIHCKLNPVRTYNLLHPSLPAGTGILTCFPSTTAFALVLGAD
jgi:hypothetical protein